MPAPARHAALVFTAGFLDVTGFGDLGDGNIPPAVVAGHALITIDRNVNDHGAIDPLGGDQRVPQLLDVAGADYVGSESLRVEGQIDWQRLAVLVRRIVS